VTPPRVPSEAEVLVWFETLSNWQRFGADDELGTLNLIDDAKRAEAARLVRDGAAVSCAWEIDPRPGVDHVFGSPERTMRGTGEDLPDVPRYAGASERIGFVFHGYAITHLDSLAHYFWDGRMYGGRPASLVTIADGATRNAVTAAGAGIVTRGVLLDIAKLRGVDWLEPGEGVFPEELEAAEARAGVRAGPGDAVLLRTGYGRKKRLRGPDRVQSVGRAGWHAACLPWLRARDVALIGADTAQDVQPCGYPSFRSPVHAIGIVAMGLWLLDNCDLEPLAEVCARLGRAEFMLTVNPLRLTGATGSPVNPIALL
jgi:kynurenine formamidase